MELSEGLNTLDFEARLYNPATALFLSPDPIFGQSDGAPHGISPRSYCAANPLRYIDPTGLEKWVFNNKGRLIECKEYKTADVIIINDEFGSEFRMMIFSPNTFHSFQNNIYSSLDQVSATRLFEFLAENTIVEWGLVVELTVTEKRVAHVTTSNDTKINQGISRLVPNILDYGNVLLIWHSHPGNTEYPSDWSDTSGNRFGDIIMAQEWNRLNESQIDYKIYLPKCKYYIDYNAYSNYFPIPLKNW